MPWRAVACRVVVGPGVVVPQLNFRVIGEVNTTKIKYSKGNNKADTLVRRLRDGTIIGELLQLVPVRGVLIFRLDSLSRQPEYRS